MADLMPTAGLAPLSPLAGRPGDARCHPAAVTARFSLRLPDNAIAPAAAALGLDLATPINRATSDGERTAIRLGPDEFLLLLPQAAARELPAALDTSLPDGKFALVDIGHRQTGFVLEAAAAAAMLNAGCPLDLDPAAFPVGMATRTVFLKAEIVLWRQAETRFHIEVWRSFAPYLWDLLAIVGREYPEPETPGPA